MSGPIEDRDAASADFGAQAIVVREGREARIGELGIVRVLPTKRRRTIGPWCFVDLMSPGDIAEPPPLEIGPHPHIGLSTVTWLLAGSALHSDSLGTEQLIRPGQLNLMTSGHGIAHAELGVDTGADFQGSGTMGVQMWLAQTEESRHGASSFQHLDELPTVEIGPSHGYLLVGSLGDASSPARLDHPTIGLELTVLPGTVVPTDPTFEYGVIPIDRPARVEEEIVDPGSLAIVPVGRESLRLDTRGEPGRVMLLGGEPLGERIQMWWNFVGRTRDELTEAWRDWRDHNEDRFGRVPSDLDRIDAPVPYWIDAG